MPKQCQDAYSVQFNLFPEMLSYHEDAIAAYFFAQKTGNLVTDDTHLYQHTDFPYALANFDRRYTRKEDGEPGILECKSCTYHKAADWQDGAYPIYLNNGESLRRLPVLMQIAWFRLRYPEGRLAVSAVPQKDCFVATARVYHHFTDPPEQFLAEATASRGYLPDKPTVSPREWAQTAAIGIALRNAGFGLQFNAAGDAFDTPVVDELGAIAWVANKFKGDADISAAAKLICDQALQESA